MNKTKVSILSLVALLSLAVLPSYQADAADIDNTVTITDSLAFSVTADNSVGDFDGQFDTPNYIATTLDYGSMNSLTKTTTPKIMGVRLYVETNATSYDIDMELDQLMTSGTDTIPNSTGNAGLVWSNANDGSGWSVFSRVAGTGTADNVASGGATAGSESFVDYRLKIDSSIPSGTYTNTTTYTLTATY